MWFFVNRLIIKASRLFADDKNIPQVTHDNEDSDNDHDDD